MSMASNEAAVALAANGSASIEDVDRAWRGIMPMPIGPFGMLDGVGLDTAWGIADYWARQTGDPRRASTPTSTRHTSTSATWA